MTELNLEYSVINAQAPRTQELQADMDTSIATLSAVLVECDLHELSLDISKAAMEHFKTHFLSFTRIFANFRVLHAPFLVWPTNVDPKYDAFLDSTSTISKSSDANPVS